MTIKFDAVEQFASRPTLRHVAITLLRSALNERYLGLGIDPGKTVVARAVPEASGKLQPFVEQSLVDSLFEHFIRQSTPRWTTDHALLPHGGSLTMPFAVDMQEISAIVDRSALGLVDGFKQAIADFWSQAGNVGDTTLTRWAWLSEAIRENLLRELEPGLGGLPDDSSKSALKAVATLSGPSLAQIQAGIAWVTLTQGSVSEDFPLPALVIVQHKDGKPGVLVYRLFGRCEHYSLDAWEAHLQQNFINNKQAQRLRWALYDASGNLFDGLTQSILENQFHAMQGFRSEASTGIEVLERYFEAITDVAGLFVAPLTPAVAQLTTTHLPDWLRNADDADRLVYSRSMAALGASQARTQGKAFDDGLPPILEFASRTLRKKMLEEHPGAKDLPLGEIELVIDKVTAVAAGSGGQVSTLGGVERVHMGLLDFALENLTGLPVGTTAVHRTTGQALPGWLTVNYLKQLIRAVDIGGVYPALLRKSLITDAAEAERRRLLFCDQLRIQLPLKALEQKLRGQGGVSDQGCRLVEALMSKASVAGHTIVLRPLAFIAQPHGRVDRVTNMFVIGSQETTRGPHLLYRPFSPTPLTEFSSWWALRAAIAETGELQQQVLLWLSDRARPVYANGGFDEPHIIHFGLGSEFAPLERPKPAVLCSEAVTGDPLSALFKANALALVELADRDSVSNVESRWANLKEGGWLLLNALLPILGDTLGNSLWLMQMFSSVGKVIALPAGADKATRSAALSDLLLNVALLVLRNGFSLRGLTHRSSATQEVPAEAATQAIAPLRDLNARQTELDFSWSSPLGRLSASERNRLNTFQVSINLSQEKMATSGIHAGLYVYQQRWYAAVGEQVFRVVASEDGFVVVNPADPSVTGPRLVRMGQGWGLDLRLRLRGGGPKQNARKLAEANAANAMRINEALAEQGRRADNLLRNTRTYLVQLTTAQGTLRELFIERYERDLTELLDVMKEHARLGQEHRPGDRPSEKEVAGELKAMARQICYFEELLLQDQRMMVNQGLAHMQTLADIEAIVPQNAEAYFELFRKLTALQTKGVRWAETREEVWSQLREVPKVGEAYWHDDVLEVYAKNHPSGLGWKSVHMFSTLELVFSRPEVMFSDDIRLLRTLRNDDTLHAAIASHVEIDKPNSYSLAECVAVVESALKEYDKASDIAAYVHSLDFAGKKGQYLEQFIAQMDGIRQAAMQRLTVLIKDSTEVSAAQPQYLPKASRPGKRVIKTRGNRTLVGSVRQGETELDGEVVDVTDALTSKVIQSWHQHADGDWVELVEAGPVRAAPANTSLLSELRQQARLLLERVEVSIINAWQQSKRANEPEDMEDILLQKADKLSGLATQMQSFSGDTTLSASVATQLATDLQNLTSAAARLRAQGREIRIAMIKAQPPTAGRISYLHQQGEINISSFDARKNMSGSRRDDFLQEFAIRDKDNRILWWAHFHYAAEDADAQAYTAGHLKLPGQRFLGYKALIRAAKANNEVVSIYRSSIGKDVARRLFLVLTP